MAGLKVLREAFTYKLRGSVAANLGLYTRDVPWLQEFSGGSAWELETGLAPANDLEVLAPEGADLKDIENAMRIHRALPELTPVQARDPRLWARLTHVELWPYMRKRWPIERHVADAGKAARFVDSRYFVSRNESRALLRNGVARLWWSAKVSYDPSRDNPYELTRVLLSALDITQQLLERSLGRAPLVVHGFLEFLRLNEELLKGGDKSRAEIRRLAKFLNLSGGVCVLDCLSMPEILALLQEEHKKAGPIEGATA